MRASSLTSLVRSMVPSATTSVADVDTDNPSAPMQSSIASVSSQGGMPEILVAPLLRAAMATGAMQWICCQAE